MLRTPAQQARPTCWQSGTAQCRPTLIKSAVSLFAMALLGGAGGGGKERRRRLLPLASVHWLRAFKRSTPLLCTGRQTPEAWCAPKKLPASCLCSRGLVRRPGSVRRDLIVCVLQIRVPKPQRVRESWC